MKSKFIKGAVIFAAVVLVTAGILAIFPGKPLGIEVFSSAVDAGKKLELDFTTYHIKLIPWEKDELKVEESQYHRDLCGGDIEFSFEDNKLAVKSSGPSLSHSVEADKTSIMLSQAWLSLIQFEKYFTYSQKVWDQTYVDFYIYVPKGAKISVFCSGIVNSPRDIDFILNE